MKLDCEGIDLMSFRVSARLLFLSLLIYHVRYLGHVACLPWLELIRWDLGPDAPVGLPRNVDLGFKDAASLWVWLDQRDM